MSISEQNFIAGLLKKAKSLFADNHITTEVLVPVQAISHEYATSGICRTPADSLVLRTNVEP